ncbi:MAG: serpin family protein [Acidimicrobiia bacterium]|nr:serpin family protein [Acidimicrobiia bacterium]
MKTPLFTAICLLALIRVPGLASDPFSTELYLLAREPGKNLVLSPFSVSAAMAMVHAGARGATRGEIAKALRFDLEGEKLDARYRDLSTQLPDAKNYDLRSANALWAHKDFPVAPAFVSLCRSYYTAPLETVDFAQPDAARLRINSWVEEATARRIRELLPPGSVDPLSRLVLTNAIHFHGKWATPFRRESTKPGPFRTLQGESVTVPMMAHSGSFRYAETGTAQMLELPYAGGRMAMLLLLPRDATGLEALEKSLPDGLPAGAASRPVAVKLPKFQFTTSLPLTNLLNQMGIKAAFDAARADFSGISTADGLALTAVLHKAFIEVNEEGTEAAAATGAIIGVTSFIEPVAFTANRPFLFLIRHAATGTVLFAGRVADPR